MIVESPAFEQYQTIPAKYTADGEDFSPPLILKEAPKGVKSFAIIVEDPDAPMGTFDHWIAWNIPGESTSIPEGFVTPRKGANSYGSLGYGGPNPPKGKPHRYFFKVFALDTSLELPDGSSKNDLQEAIHGHVLSQSELVGLYQHS